jgi:hypothetical protein
MVRAGYLSVAIVVLCTGCPRPSRKSHQRKTENRESSVLSPFFVFKLAFESCPPRGKHRTLNEARATKNWTGGKARRHARRRSKRTDLSDGQSMIVLIYHMRICVCESMIRMIVRRLRVPILTFGPKPRNDRRRAAHERSPR